MSAALRLEGRLGRGWVVVVLLAVFVPFYVVYFRSDAAFSLAHARAACGGRSVLDTHWGYSAATAQQYLAACGASGRHAVVAQQLADLVYPLLYALALGSIVAVLLRAVAPARSRWHLLVFLPFVAAAADYVENIGVWQRLIAYPSRGTAVPFFSAVTASKQALGFAGFALVGALLIALIVRGAARRSTERGLTHAAYPVAISKGTAQ